MAADTEQSISLMTVRIQDLGNTGIMLVSKFARKAMAKHGTIILLHKPHVLNQVAAHAAKYNDDELNTIYNLIEFEVRKHLQKTLPQSYKTVALHYRELERQLSA